MLRLSISIKNPVAKDVNLRVYDCNKKLSKHKHFEAEHYYCGYFLFKLMIDISWRGEDHAGPEIELCLFGYSARYKIYDTRHWNYEHGRWMTDSEQDDYFKQFDSYV